MKHVKQCFKQCFLHNLKTILLSLWLVIFAFSRRSTLENLRDSKYLLLFTSFFLCKTVSTFYFIWNNANWLNKMHSSWLNIKLSTDLSADLSTDFSTDLLIKLFTELSTELFTTELSTELSIELSTELSTELSIELLIKLFIKRFIKLSTCFKLLINWAHNMSWTVLSTWLLSCFFTEHSSCFSIKHSSCFSIKHSSCFSIKHSSWLSLWFSIKYST